MERVLLQYNRYVITPCKKDTDLSSIKSGNAVRSRDIVSRTYKKVNRIETIKSVVGTSTRNITVRLDKGIW